MQPCARVAQAAGAIATPRLGTLAAPCLQLAAIMPRAPPISLKFLGCGALHHVAFSGSGDLKPLCHPVFLPLLGFGFAFRGSKGLLGASCLRLGVAFAFGKASVSVFLFWVQSQDDPSEVDGTGTGAIASWHLVGLMG